jgi:hypothetical protein
MHRIYRYGCATCLLWPRLHAEVVVPDWWG